jgi:CRP-like cAMP-binding protein
LRPDPTDLDILRNGPWYGALPAALQARIAAVGVVRSYRRGQFLIRQGDPPRGLIGVISGRTRHVCAVGDDCEVLMHVGGPGLWTGEYPTLTGKRAIGSVVADAPTRAMLLPLREWQRMVDEHPRWLRPLAELVAERFAFAFRLIAESQGLTREDRLHVRLRRVAEVQQPDQGAGPASVSMSQSQIATMIGVSRQTLSAMLARLQARGLVRVCYRRIELLR